jgi:hypothetical protein
MPVKVKYFGFPLSIKGGGLFAGTGRVENAGELEQAVNEWLDSRPSIRIAHIQQTATRVSGIGNQFLYLTVWYEDGAERGCAPDRVG